MALTPAQKQQAYRDRLKEKVQVGPEAVEAALMAEVERAQRGELSEAERNAVADQKLNALLRGMRERIGDDLIEADVRASIKWALRHTTPQAAADYRLSARSRLAAMCHLRTIGE
jgi:hypothetical protein